MILFNENDNSHAALIEKWWMELTESGEIKEVFMLGAHPVIPFIKLFTPPNEMVFDFDDKGIFMAFWAGLVLSGVVVGVWMREDKRRVPSVAKNVLKLLRRMVLNNPIVFSITKRKNHLPFFKKLGYTISEEILGLFGDTSGWFMYIHKGTIKRLPGQGMIVPYGIKEERVNGNANEAFSSFVKAMA